MTLYYKTLYRNSIPPKRVDDGIFKIYTDERHTFNSCSIEYAGSSNDKYECDPGILIKIPEGYHGIIAPLHSLSCHNIYALCKVYKSGYCGKLTVTLFYNEKTHCHCNNSSCSCDTVYHTIDRRDKICYLIIEKNCKIDLEEDKELIEQ